MARGETSEDFYKKFVSLGLLYSKIYRYEFQDSLVRIPLKGCLRFYDLLFLLNSLRHSKSIGSFGRNRLRHSRSVPLLCFTF